MSALPEGPQPARHAWSNSSNAVLAAAPAATSSSNPTESNGCAPYGSLHHVPHHRDHAAKVHAHRARLVDRERRPEAAESFRKRTDRRIDHGRTARVARATQTDFESVDFGVRARVVRAAQVGEQGLQIGRSHTSDALGERLPQPRLEERGLGVELMRYAVRTEHLPYHPPPWCDAPGHAPRCRRATRLRAAGRPPRCRPVRPRSGDPRRRAA